MYTHDFVHSYDSHAPIVITSDQDFEDQLWPGEGTELEPYVIENLNITGSGNSIEISNTRKYFVIRDCVLSSVLYDGAGIRLSNATNALVEFCTIHTRIYGIDLIEISSSLIRNNSISDCNLASIFLYQTNTTHIWNNTIISTGDQGVYVTESQDIDIIKNGISNVDGNGILVYDSLVCTVENNRITNAGANGISIEQSAHCLASHNLITITVWGGMVAYQSPNSDFISNEISFTGEYGIWIAYSPYSSVVANKLDDTGGLTIEYGSDYTDAIMNEIQTCLWMGIRINGGTGCTIDSNTLRDIGQDGILVHGNSNDINVIGNTIDTPTLQGISFDDAHDVSVTSNIIRHVPENGILFTNGSTDGIFAANDIQDCGEYGFRIQNSHNITISDSSVSHIDSSGIYVQSCDLVEISNNTISYCDLAGIEVYSSTSGADINLNIIDNMGTYGIAIVGAPGSSIIGNFVRFASSYNIRIASSENSEIYLNGFVESLGIYGRVTVSPGCIWTSGTYGNYWGDYNGTDEDYDGVGDTPYTVDTDQVDPHPLIDFRFIGAYERVQESELVLTLTTYPSSPVAGEDFVLILQVDDPERVSSVAFRYSIDNGVTWTGLSTHFDDNSWNATVPGQPAETRIYYAVDVLDMGGDTISSEVLFVDITTGGTSSPLDIIAITSIALGAVIVIVVAKTGIELRKQRSQSKWESRF